MSFSNELLQSLKQPIILTESEEFVSAHTRVAKKDTEHPMFRQKIAQINKEYSHPSKKDSPEHKQALADAHEELKNVSSLVHQSHAAKHKLRGMSHQHKRGYDEFEHEAHAYQAIMNHYRPTKAASRKFGESKTPEIDEKFAVGDNVHIGHVMRGGSGYKGKLIKIDGEHAHVELPPEPGSKWGNRVIKGKVRNLTRE